MTRRFPGFSAAVKHRCFAAALAIAIGTAPAAALRCQSACDAAADRAPADGASCHEDPGSAPAAPASGHSCRGHLAACILAAASALPASAPSVGIPALAPPPAAGRAAGDGAGRLESRRPSRLESPRPSVSASVLRL